jgi:molybdenum cofactor cytidylyltransferase
MPRYFALIPAAGHSTRMGRAKLLLPLTGRPLIAHTIDAWRRGRVDRIIVVVRPGDDALAAFVRALTESHVELVVPEAPPPDMKASLQAALKHIEQNHQPTHDDAFLVAPADMPQLAPAIINRLIEGHSTGSKRDILVPTIAGQRGHPVLFPWPLAAEVFQLAADEGLNAIVERDSIQVAPCDDLIAAGESPFADIDTPQQFQQLVNRPLTADN